jgi:vacuolar-type H+-ATPase subunit H
LKITEILKVTLQAEAEAEKIIEEAKVKAEEILTDAEALSEIRHKESYEATLRRHRDEINQRIENEKIVAEKYAKDILANVDNSVEAIRASSLENVDKAVNTLLEEITKLGLE